MSRSFSHYNFNVINILNISIILHIPKIAKYLKILTNEEVKDSVVKYFCEQIITNMTGLIKRLKIYIQNISLKIHLASSGKSRVWVCDNKEYLTIKNIFHRSRNIYNKWKMKFCQNWQIFARFTKFSIFGQIQIAINYCKNFK